MLKPNLKLFDYKTLKQFSLDPILVMVVFSIITEDKHNSDNNAGLKEKYYRQT
jgi:hypothetical protein